MTVSAVSVFLVLIGKIKMVYDLSELILSNLKRYPWLIRRDDLSNRDKHGEWHVCGVA